MHAKGGNTVIKIGDIICEIIILLVSTWTTLVMWGGIDTILTMMQLTFIVMLTLSIANDTKSYNESLRNNRARHQAGG